MQQVAAGAPASWSGLLIRDIGVIVGFTGFALVGVALTLRRQTGGLRGSTQHPCPDQVGSWAEVLNGQNLG
jgi:hypothetical protein